MLCTVELVKSEGTGKWGSKASRLGSSAPRSSVAISQHYYSLVGKQEAAAPGAQWHKPTQEAQPAAEDETVGAEQPTAGDGDTGDAAAPAALQPVEQTGAQQEPKKEGQVEKEEGPQTGSEEEAKSPRSARGSGRNGVKRRSTQVTARQPEPESPPEEGLKEEPAAVATDEGQKDKAVAKEKAEE